MKKEKSFYSDEGVGETALYRVHHDAHGLPSEVTLRAGHIFPGCSKCDEPVRFELVRPVSTDESGFFVNLYTLPASDGPAVHSDAHIQSLPNLQQDREHAAVQAFLKRQRNSSEANGHDSGEDENAA